MQTFRDKDVAAVVAHMELLLANMHMHYQNLRNFHWHVSGPHFLTLHTHFETLYTDSAQAIDDVAERLLALGTFPNMSLARCVEEAEIEDQSALRLPSAMLQAVRKGHEVMIRHMEQAVVAANAVQDFGTGDMLTTMIAGLEKQNWILEALLQERS